MKERSQLIVALRAVGRKLQYERLLKGLAILLGCFLAGSTLSGYLLANENFSQGALFWTRLIGSLTLLFLVMRYVFQPASHPPSRRQVARFLEERHPSMQDRLSTAVEAGGGSSQVHPGIRELIERDAWNRLRGLHPPRFYRPKASGFWLGIVLVSLLTLGGLFFAGPEAYRYSLAKVFGGWLDRDRPPLYTILVTPGNTKVGKRADVEIRAALQGFDSQRVKLSARYENEPGWEELEMHPDREGNEFAFLFFDVRDRIEYYVRAEGIRSETYTIQVRDLPQVENFKIVLNFPGYANLPNRAQEDEGDIRALAGTKAQFSIRTDQPVRSGSIRLEERDEVSLKLVGPQELTGTLEVSEDGAYRIYLQDRERFWNPGSSEYLIEALKDQPPVIFFTRPGRDLKVTNIQEVFTELRAEDDHGIKELTVRFSLNGEPEQEIGLDLPRRSHSFSSSYTFYMERFKLQPGDLVSYHAQVSDAVSSSATDIYFLEVEPYDREYYQSQGGMPAAGGRDLRLSRRQKQIIAATFNLERRKRELSSSEFKESTQTAALVQQRLQQETRTILDRIERRGGVAANPRLRKMAAYLNQAILHMDPAYHHLSQQKPAEALPPEQKSFQQLLRAEALFREIQVAFARNQASGAGEASAEELANLVDLELDKTKNQYETLQQNQSRRREQALDEVLEKLKELARRQEQLAERRRRGSSGGGHSLQNQLVEETERLTRQLERLSRGQKEERLADISNQLRQAVRDMRHFQGPGRESQLRAQRALERLKQAEKALGRQRQDQMTESLEQLKADSEQLLKEQEGVIGKIRQLVQQQRSGEIDQDFLRSLRSLLQEKAGLQEDVQKLEGALHESARQTASAQAKTSRKLKRAGLDIRERQLPEKMREGSELLARGWTDLASQREEDVRSDLKEVAEKISEAARSLGSQSSPHPREKLKRALSQIGRVVENLRSLEERALDHHEATESGGTVPSQGKEADSRKETLGRRSSTQRQSEGPETGVASSGAMTNPGTIGARRIRREWQEHIHEAERIGRELRGYEDLARDLGRLLGRMRRLDSQRLFLDVQEIARLKAQVIDGFRQLELEIHQAVQQEETNLLRLVDEQEVPPQFRKQVEAYYRALSKGRRESQLEN